MQRHKIKLYSGIVSLLFCGQVLASVAGGFDSNSVENIVQGAVNFCGGVATIMTIDMEKKNYGVMSQFYADRFRSMSGDNRVDVPSDFVKNQLLRLESEEGETEFDLGQAYQRDQGNGPKSDLFNSLHTYCNQLAHMPVDTNSQLVIQLKDTQKFPKDFDVFYDGVQRLVLDEQIKQKGVIVGEEVIHPHLFLFCWDMVKEVCPDKLNNFAQEVKAMKKKKIWDNESFPLAYQAKFLYIAFYSLLNPLKLQTGMSDYALVKSLEFAKQTHPTLFEPELFNIDNLQDGQNRTRMKKALEISRKYIQDNFPREQAEQDLQIERMKLDLTYESDKRKKIEEESQQSFQELKECMKQLSFVKNEQSQRSQLNKNYHSRLKLIKNQEFIAREVVDRRYLEQLELRESAAIISSQSAWPVVEHMKQAVFFKAFAGYSTMFKGLKKNEQAHKKQIKKDEQQKAEQLKKQAELQKIIALNKQNVFKIAAIKATRDLDAVADEFLGDVDKGWQQLKQIEQAARQQAKQKELQNSTPLNRPGMKLGTGQYNPYGANVLPLECRYTGV